MSEHNGSTKSPVKTVARNVSDLASNIITLVELQAELLKSELRQWLSAMVSPLVMLAAALVIALGCVPVLLFSLAAALVEWLGWPESLSLLVAALAGLVVVAIAAAIGWHQLRRSITTFKHSQEEFSRNLKWLKQVLNNQLDAAESESSPSVAAR